MSEKPKASFSIVSLLAIVAAIWSFFQGATFGLLLALAAIVLGIIGLLISFSASKRGGIVSLTSIVFGVVGIIAAIIKASLYLFG
ncbi:hypothetical protein HAHE_21570 [Haloferula helveola]|uniref:Major facilitator superfamily (MFS) profile domain-containing protein n=1 Tax=Haloferula helveola TaxID=490095 RepID=A0ABM7RDR9_9BACT|nr:hypothetical protein HAHE_21570 [Haloferula helveola]